MHKMNIFHWHLTEDQGWRVEIESYPKLTEISAYRDESLIGHYRDEPRKYDGKKYGGYYTKDEMKDIVDYAQKRYITVVPEIEMPGHSRAALAAYPELSCTGGPHTVAKLWGVHKEVFCSGKESTFEFLESVLMEVSEIFPGEYIHIGGDECPKDRWKNHDLDQDRMREERLSNENELQSYFINFGGHASAAGFSIRSKDFESFKKDLLSLDSKNKSKKSEKKYSVDLELPINNLNFHCKPKLCWLG